MSPSQDDNLPDDVRKLLLTGEGLLADDAPPPAGVESFSDIELAEAVMWDDLWDLVAWIFEVGWFTSYNFN
ncbi:hypothetical protein NX059_000905 [Plenodomus lindquistii]|nr:hypothetical protein NX059_000905 [Plenodomus lindquistii]